MAYRLLELRLRVGAESSLRGDLDADVDVTLSQTLDKETCSKRLRVGPSDAEAQVDISPVTTGYCVAVFSDYPVKLRINGAAETQFTGKTNNVSAVNVGAPLPYQYVFLATVTCTRLDIAPITSAAQTATVKVVVTGDPTTAY
jgi:hypothetical protein